MVYHADQASFEWTPDPDSGSVVYSGLILSARRRLSVKYHSLVLIPPLSSTHGYFKAILRPLTATPSVVKTTLRPLSIRKVLRSTNELHHTVSEPLTSTLGYFIASRHFTKFRPVRHRNLSIRPYSTTTRTLTAALIEPIRAIYLNYAKDTSASLPEPYNWLVQYY